MQRLHVHLGVSDLDRSIGFYTVLFGKAPSVQKPDYAKWQLDDPRINFAISTQAARKGVDHLGIQVDSDAALAALSDRLGAAGHAVREEPGAACCYARSDKAWTADPEDVSWELFHTIGAIETYRTPEDACCGTEAAAETTACCGA